MKIVPWLAVGFCVPVVLLANWVGFPISYGLPGTAFVLFGGYDGDARFTLLSFGVAAAIVLLLALHFWFRKSHMGLSYAGAGLFLLAAWALLKVAMGDGLLLQRLMDEADWQLAAYRFALRYLPSNVGVEPGMWKTFSLSTPEGRLISGWYFMGLGWYATLGGSFVCLASSLKGVERGAVMRTGAVAFGLFVGLVVWFSAGPIVSARALDAGAREQAEGHLRRALKEYRLSLQTDSWRTLTTYERVGLVDLDLGRGDLPEAHIYRAESLVRQGRILEGIEAYQAIKASSQPLAKAINARASVLWTRYGLALYSAGAFGEAVQAWQRAMSLEPTMWLAGFYLSRGYYALQRYQDAIGIARRCAAHIADPVMRADLDSDVGDALARQGELALAHQAYSSSNDLDYVRNRRAAAGLIGP